MNRKIVNIIFFVFIVVNLGSLIFIISYVVTNKEAFMENPMVFGVNQMNLKECYCSCYNNINPIPISLYFNQTSFSGGENPL